MTTKTTKRKTSVKKQTLRFKITPEQVAQREKEINALAQDKMQAEWEKRFTELEQQLHRRTDARTMDMIVNTDIEPRISIGGDHYRIFNPDYKQVMSPKGTTQELAEEINMEANRVKQLAIDVKHKLISKLGDLPPQGSGELNKCDPPSPLPPIESELRAVKSELAQIYSILSYINDLQEVKL